MKKEIEISGITDLKSEDDHIKETLPSRRSRHQRPLTFFEKPVFSFIIFILFILILGSIFIYFMYIKDDQATNKLNTIKNTSEIKSTDDVINSAKETVSDSKPSSVPVVNTSDPVSNDKDEVDVETKIVEPITQESATEEVNSESITFITHEVVEGDTLYKLTKRYYGSSTQEYRQKIMNANNLKDENIRLNSTLIIPEPMINP